MSFSPEEQSRLDKQICWKHGWLVLSYELAAASERKINDLNSRGADLNLTGDPSTRFLIKIENRKTREVTSARWENDGVAVSRRNFPGKFYQADLTGSTPRFCDGTIEKIASELLRIAVEEIS